MPIHNLFHPDYSACSADWRKYWLAYEATQQYVNEYLRKLSDRESVSDHNKRKLTAYVPRYAAAAVDEIKDSILQRLIDIKREGGSDTYKRCVLGEDKGVDYQYSDMTTFMGNSVLLDLLVFSKVGVLVDNYQDPGTTAMDQTGHPYVRRYNARDIRSWSISDVDKGFDSLLLVEKEAEYAYGLVSGYYDQYRLLQRKDGGVLVTVWYPNPDFSSKRKEDKTNPKYIHDDPTFMDIERIPFTTIHIKRALMQDIADMQTELMNLESSDVNYALQSNLPFYVQTYSDEQNMYAKSNIPSVTDGGELQSGPHEVRAGTKHGVIVPEGVRLPTFIAPPADNLKISMEKGKQIREMIRSTVNLNLQALTVQRESAESKRSDKDTMEAALSVIAKKLEIAEKEIAYHWGLFDESGGPARISYPKKFSLLTNKERIADAKAMLETAESVPSLTFKRETSKRVVDILLGAELSSEELNKIYAEIDKTPTVSDAKTLLDLVERGGVRKATVNEILGIRNAESEADKAIEERVAFIKTTLEAQGGLGARGLSEADDDSSSQEKAGKTRRGEQVDPTQGEQNDTGT